MSRYLIISRREAQQLGKKRFYTGKLCHAGHDAERFVANGNCVECGVFQTPAKRQGPRGNNVRWPSRAFVFEARPAPTMEEMEAAMNMMQELHWHDHAVTLLRKDPKLVSIYLNPVPVAEVAQAMHLLERAQIVRDRIQKLVNPRTDEGEGST